VNHSPYSVTVDAADYAVQGAGNSLVYEIPLPKAIGKLGGCRWDRDIKIIALDELGKAGDRSCVHRFHTFSPLVFNMEGAGMVTTTSPYQSPVHFDLDGNGLRESTGWVGAKSALLALDLNGNGQIDSGRELFGEATVLVNTREKAEHGYAALAQYDSNKDGKIDSLDAIYPKLKLWFDINHDGRSQPHELRSLSQTEVKAISLNYSEVPAQQQIQTFGTPEPNVVKYQARFFGPKACGVKGCASYDVYFGSTEASFALNK